MAAEFIKGHRKYGVLTSLKHFPGHGSSKDDTHLGIADVTNTWEERELKPYQALIDSGFADAVMTSHIVNRKLDKNGNPGTLSSDVLTGILRNKLNFDGVIFTDDMQMQAISKHFGLEESIKLAINGGVDIMTFSNNIQETEDRTVDKVHSIIYKMVESGEISRSRIDESYKRIMKLKERLNANNRAVHYQQELEKSNQALTEAQAQLRSAEEKIKTLEANATVTKKKKSKKKNK
jgi:beta-N-acetylhexosaminidase